CSLLFADLTDTFVDVSSSRTSGALRDSPLKARDTSLRDSTGKFSSPSASPLRFTVIWCGPSFMVTRTSFEGLSAGGFSASRGVFTLGEGVAGGTLIPGERSGSYPPATCGGISVDLVDFNLQIRITAIATNPISTTAAS